MAFTAFETVADQSDEDPLELMDEIERLKKEKDATILAHFYVDSEIQDIADYSGDSLKLARDAASTTSSTIVFAGVHFMAESAKNPLPGENRSAAGSACRMFLGRQLPGSGTRKIPAETPG